MVINMNYPKGIVKPQHNSIIYSNRGMNLESDLNTTCEYYLQNDKAIIYKKPTPITISKVDYTNKKDAVIKEGHFRIPSTTDYNGIYKGKYIDFEAKETKCESFPLRNIHAHQIKHLRSIVKHGGIGFLIVRFTTKNETFYLKAEDLFEFIDNNQKSTIPHTYFEKKGYLIKDKYNPRCDFLKIIEYLYFGGNNEN